MKPENRRGSAFRRAVVLPTVLLLGAGGALVATPAFADTAPSDGSTTTASSTTAGSSAADSSTSGSGTTTSATSTATAAPDPTASVSTTQQSASSSGTSSPTAPSTSTPVAAPKKESAPPKTLIVTTPAVDADGDPVVVHGDPRVVTIAGRAPVQSSITVTDDEGNTTGPVVADANGDWSISVTVKPTDSYDQYFEVDATHAGHDLDPEFVEVLFDAPQSVAPVITSPVTGDTVIGEPEPFIGTDPDLGAVVAIPVSGTGTPGDDIEIEADETSAEPDAGGFGFGGETTVAANGTWSTVVDVSFDRYTLTATQQKLDDQYDPLTVASDDSNSVAVAVDEPAGYVAAPDITTPAYEDDDTDPSSTVEVEPSGSDVASSQSASATALKRAGISLPGSASQAAPLLGTAAATARLKARAESTPADDSGAATGSDDGAGSGDDSVNPADYDEFVAESGIPVTGAADASGAVETTVSGTGTPGDGIVLYSAKPSVALLYFAGLYPDVFDGSGVDVSASAQATVPIDDGSITVGADGKWTAKVPLATGPLFLTAFAVDRTAAAGADYSVAGTLLALNVTADPAAAVAPAAATVPTLAFTGSDDRGELAIAFSALLAGGALVVVNARRRRRRDAAASADRD